MFKDILNLIDKNVIFDSMYNGIVVTTAKLEGPDYPKILCVNKSFEETTGYKEEEVIGKTPRILQGEKTDRKVLDRLKQTLLQGEYFEGSTVNYRKNGTPYHVEWNITPIFKDGEIVYFFCVQRDITESIKYRRSLEEKIKKELEKIEFQENLILKQSKSAAMGEMIDSIAHQWLNPLATIKMCINMIEYTLEDMDIQNPELNDYVDRAVRGTSHLENTIRQFRSFFRPITNVEEICIKELIDNVSLLMKDELIANKIEIEYKDFDDKKVNVVVNEFIHVLLNIFNNSKEAFIENEIKKRKIIVSCTSDDKMVSLQICDNAGGIPSDIIDKIFEQNFTTKEKGTGIGLYMTKQIVDKSGAEIYVKNTLDGTCFDITFKSLNTLKQDIP